MIIERNIFEIKHGRWDEAIALVKEEIAIAENAGSNIHARVLTPVFAPFDQLLMEAEFDSLIAAGEFWEKWSATRETKFSPKFDPLITSSGSSEVWTVHEPVGSTTRGKYVNWRMMAVTPGHSPEVTALLSKSRGDSKRYNILVPYYGPRQRVVMVGEFDNFEAYFQEWDTWAREGATPEFWQVWNEATAPGGENVVWQVA